MAAGDALHFRTHLRSLRWIGRQIDSNFHAAPVRRKGVGREQNIPKVLIIEGTEGAGAGIRVRQIKRNSFMSKPRSRGWLRAASG